MQQDKNTFVLEVKPGEFRIRLRELREQLKRDKKVLKDFVEVTTDLQSYLLKWNLQNPENPDNVLISDENIMEEVGKNYSLLERLGYGSSVDEIKNDVGSINSSNMHRLSLESDKGLINNRWGNNDGTGLK